MGALRKKIQFEILGRDSFDKVLLLFAFIIGIFGNLAIKYLTTAVLLPAIFSALIIITYALWTFNSDSVRLEPDQIGDNSYYLGFILTLCSLAHTLYEISAHSMESEFVANVISGFGVALSSTIVGVATRVFMQQYRLDLTARDHEARLAINKAMQDFRSELTNSIRGMKNFGAELRQSLEEHHEATAIAHEEHLNLAIESVLSSFKSSMNQVVESSKNSNSIMAQNSKITIEETKNSLVGVLQDVERSCVFTGKIVSKATENIGKTVTLRLEENNNALAIHARQTQQTNQQLNTSIMKFEDTLKSIIDRIESDVSTATYSAEIISKSLASSAKEMQVSIKSVDEDMRNISKQLNNQICDVMSISQKASCKESEAAMALKSAIISVENHVDNLNRLILTQNTKINKMIESTMLSESIKHNQKQIKIYSLSNNQDQIKEALHSNAPYIIK